MIVLSIAILIFLIVFVERRWAGKALSFLTFTEELDKKLVEPDEEITLTSKLSNHASLPVLYVRQIEYFPTNFKICEEKEWMLKHTNTDIFNIAVDYRMYLMARTRHVAKLHFSIPQRGVYSIGRYTLAAGDFLGLHNETRQNETWQNIVVYPRRTADKIKLSTLGGFIGDISVRRFILEDPILITGYDDYTGREPFKSISWKKTAQAGQLKVKQYDHTVDANVAVILNMQAEAANFERCLEYTRTVCEELEKKQIPYEFYTNGDFKTPLGQTSFLPQGLGKQHLNMILYGLGNTRGSVYFSLDTLVNQCISKRKADCSYIVITEKLLGDDAKPLEKLQKYSDVKLCVLSPESEG